VVVVVTVVDAWRRFEDACNRSDDPNLIELAVAVGLILDLVLGVDDEELVAGA